MHEFGSATDWGAVLAVKPLSRAKSRMLGLERSATEALVAAMFEDVLAAFHGCGAVRWIVVVTDDATISAIGHSYAASVISDPGAGLNEALRWGAARLPEEARSVVFAPSDLACLTSTALSECLSRVRAGESYVVPDREGRGTAMLLTDRDQGFTPLFGSESFSAHVAAGARPLTAVSSGLRLDVDAPADLADAIQLGAGPRTSAVYTRLGLSGRHRVPA